MAIHPTIVEKFIDYVDKNKLSFSYKLIFLKGMFALANESGIVEIDKLIPYYTNFYKDRLDNHLKVDRNKCPYNYVFWQTKIR